MINLTKKQRLEQLSQTIGVCFAVLKDYDTKEIANYTGLCTSTIYNLRNGHYSLAVRFGTIQALGLAAGLMITMDKHGLRLSNASK